MDLLQSFPPVVPAFSHVVQESANRPRLSSITPAPYNPRGIKAKELAGLQYSVEEFGDLSGITVNDRTGNQISGHQRVKALIRAYGDLEIEGEFSAAANGDRFERVVCPNGDVFTIRHVDWDEDKERAANVAANSPHISGDFTDELGGLLLQIKQTRPDDFAKMSMDRFGLLDQEEDSSAADPIYPITPEFNEKYDYVIVMAKNETDIAFLRTVLNLDTEQSYKGSDVGTPHVISFEKFQELWKSR